MKYQGERLRELLAGEYVLGLLTGAARRRFERLLMESGTLRASVTAWEGRFAAWALTLPPEQPPNYLWWRVLGRVRSERLPRRQQLHNVFWRGWAVAATVLLAIIIVGQSVRRPMQEKPAEFALVSDKQGQPLWVISVHPESQSIDMKAMADNTPPPGKSYELWMLPGSGKPVAMGLMNSTGIASETVPPEMLAAIANAKVLAISLEPAGGSPTGQPTGPVLYTAAIVSS